MYRDAPWDTVLDAFDEVMASAYSVSLMGDVDGPVIQQLWRKARVESVGDGAEGAGARAGVVVRRYLVRRR